MRAMQRTSFTPHLRPWIWAWLVLPCLAIACEGQTEEGGKPATRKICVAVRQHMADLRIASVEKNSALGKAELAKHRANMSTVSEHSLDICTESRSQAWAECMLALTQSQDAVNCE